jgi:hypothetical protein
LGGVSGLDAALFEESRRLMQLTFMKNQLDRLAKRSGIADISKHIYSQDPEQCKTEAFTFLEISGNRLL